MQNNGQKTLNVWLVQTGEPLPLDSNVVRMRTALLVEHLLMRGHTVVWWTSAFNHIKKKWICENDSKFQLKDRLDVIALKGIGYKKNISVARFIDHRIIANKFKKMARKIILPDVIVASTPPHDIAYEALKIGKDNKIPVIVDIRDPWPDIFLNHIPFLFKHILRVLLFNDYRMTKRTMQLADGLVAVSAAFLKWGLKYAGRQQEERDKVFYIGFKKDINDTARSPEGANKVLAIIPMLKGKFVVTFIGTLSRHNNPTILAESARRLQEAEIHFVVAGDGEFFNAMKQKTSDLLNLHMLGWLNLEEMNLLMKHSNIGVCTTSEFLNIFPNKAFAYLSAGLPIVSAWQGDVKTLIDKERIGFNYEPNDLASFEGCIRRLYNDKVLYEEMANNAQRVFKKMFDANEIYNDYAKYIEKIAHDHAQRNN